MVRLRMTLNICIALLLAALLPRTAAADTDLAKAISGDAVTANDASHGVVLLAVRWDRRWRCGGFENAQLRLIGFDKLPSAKTHDAADADIVLSDAPLVNTKPIFDNYAFLVEPGDYGLSRLEIKAAKSTSDVGFFKVPRSKLLEAGKPLGGSFTVGAGEVIYIGHFYLECKPQPTLWRFYPNGRPAFDEYLASLKNVYPRLEVQKVLFRLFRTERFGYDYQLP